MLSKCANSVCSKPFLRLREGKLFLVETEHRPKTGESITPPFVRVRQQRRSIERYWLCSDCALRWTLIYDREQGITLAPVRKPVLGAAAAKGAQNGAA